MSIETFRVNQSPAKPAKGLKSEQSMPLREGYLRLGFMGLEMVSLFLLGLTIAHGYVGMFLQETEIFPLYSTPLMLLPILMALKFNRDGFYETPALIKPSTIALDLMKSAGTVFIILIIIGFLSGLAHHYSRVWYVMWAASSVGVSLILRGAFSHFLNRITKGDTGLSQVAIFGDLPAALKLRAQINAESSGLKVVGIYTENGNSIDANVAGSLEDLIEAGQRVHIDRIIIAKDTIVRFDLSRLLRTLSILPCEVLLYPGFLGISGGFSEITTVHENRFIRVQKKPISEWGLLAKSLFDKSVALVSLIGLSPLLLATAVAIKLDSKGPVFFRQKRHGYNQKEINVWKFRTMTVMENGSDFKQATKNDARITRIGSFLRKSSIDELPQLFNVLAGEMSIVGPRPHPIALNEDFRARLMHYENRHKVKPGITGWAQVNGYRGPTDEPEKMRKRVEYDLDYIENWSLWFDIKIILATPYYGLISKNAF